MPMPLLITTAITDTATDTVTVMVSVTDTTDILTADTTDTTATISANDPPMPKLHLKPKLMPMPPHTTTAITVTATDTDITDILMALMADTTDITDIPMLMLTDMPIISANVTPKPMLPQLPMLMPMPPPFTTELIADITDILMLMPHTTPDIMPPMSYPEHHHSNTSALPQPPMVPTKYTNVRLKPPPPSSMASTIPELPDTPEQPLPTLTDPSKELHISHTEDIMADITDSVAFTDTLISVKKLY